MLKLSIIIKYLIFNLFSLFLSLKDEIINTEEFKKIIKIFTEKIIKAKKSTPIFFENIKIICSVEYFIEKIYYLIFIFINNNLTNFNNFFYLVIKKN